mgnify:CR=1 FL=1
MEFRKSNISSWTSTNKIDRGEGTYCENINGLNSNIYYKYRACSEDGCGIEKAFKTVVVPNNLDVYTLGLSIN